MRRRALITQNLGGVVYFNELTQWRLIDHRLAEQHTVPSENEVREGLVRLIQRINGTPKQKGYIGTFFSNHGRYRYNGRNYGLTLIAYPVNGALLDYYPRRGDFFVNTGTDPLEIKEIMIKWIPWSRGLLFRRNPFKNACQYRQVLEKIMPDRYPPQRGH